MLSDNKFFCVFCAREMSVREGTLRCTRGSMSFSKGMDRDIRDAVDDQPVGVPDPDSLGDPTAAHCPRCAKTMKATGMSRTCPSCGLVLSPEMIRQLREFHRHWQFRGIL